MERRFFALFFLSGALIFFAVTFVRNARARPSLRKAFIVIRYDQLSETKIWPAESHNLSKEEKQEVYELGRKLNARYRKFLGYHYKPEEYSAYSIPNENAVAVAQLLSSVLFPPPDTHWWKNEKRWRNMTVFPETFFNRTTCPRLFDEIIASRKDINLHIKHNDSGADFVQEVAANSAFFDDMTAMFLKFFRFNSYIFGFQRHLIGGPYVEKLNNFFNENSKKMEVHAWSNMNILILLNILQIKVNPTASVIAIELHENGKENNLEVYHISNSQSFKSAPMMACGTSCAIVNLVSLSQDYNREEYKELCQSRAD